MIRFTAPTTWYQNNFNLTRRSRTLAMGDRREVHFHPLFYPSSHMNLRNWFQEVQEQPEEQLSKYNDESRCSNLQVRCWKYRQILPKVYPPSISPRLFKVVCTSKYTKKFVEDGEERSIASYCTHEEKKILKVFLKMVAMATSHSFWRFYLIALTVIIPALLQNKLRFSNKHITKILAVRSCFQCFFTGFI